MCQKPQDGSAPLRRLSRDDKKPVSVKRVDHGSAFEEVDDLIPIPFGNQYLTEAAEFERPERPANFFRQLGSLPIA